MDFCCVEWKLIVESDGGQHLEQKEQDRPRTNHLRALGFYVLRFWNDEVLTKTDDVLEEIVRFLESSDGFHHHPSVVLHK